MKYFCDANRRIASGNENYVEFMVPDPKKGFWDDESIYMLETDMKDTGFEDFLHFCVREFILFDTSSFSKEELSLMTQAAGCRSEIILEIISELHEWAEAYLTEPSQRIMLNWGYDRAMYLAND